MNIPEVRFPEFTEEWEKQKLSNILEFEYGMNAAGKEFDGENKYIRITDIEESSRKFLQTKLVSPEGKVTEKYRVKFGDILFARTGASTGKTYKYIDNDGKIYFAGFLIRGRVDKKTSVDFIFYLTLNYKYKSWINVMSMRSGQPGINAKEYGSYEFRIPKIEEQQKIGDFFMLLDKRIEQQEQKIALLKDYKKGITQKIFSQKIRFKDDNGNDYPDWEEKILGDVIFRNSKKNKNQKYTLIQSISNKYGFVNQEDYFEDRRVGSLDVSNYYIIKKGYFAYNPSRINVGSLAYKNDNNISIISPLYVSFKGNEKYLNDKFLLSWLFSHQFIGKLGKLFEGSVRNTLSYENLSTIGIDTPCIAEQDKIALFLEVIDKNIENQELLINELKEQKQGVLGKMFV